MAWDEVLGHELAKRLWQAHLATHHVANAYLLVGPEGIGKRRLALEMTKALNCLDASKQPCDACTVCGQIARQVHPDVHALVPSGASEQIKIEDVRHVLGRIALKPFSARVQVVLLDGTERLTEEAANSLLKSLEEPPAHTHFLLMTAQLSHCLPTIVSRCQLIRCQPLPTSAVERILIDTHHSTPELARTIARLADGSASRAKALADRWADHERIVNRFALTSPTAWLTQPLPDTRDEVLQLLDGMMSWLRDLAMSVTGQSVFVADTDHVAALGEQAATVDVDRCLDAALAVIELRESLEQFVSPRLVAALAREQWLSLLQMPADA